MSYPKQGQFLWKTCKVIYPKCSRATPFNGIIVRDDIEGTCLTIIQLHDGRFVLATECQYTIDDRADA